MEESRIAFLQRLINSPSPSGFEQRVQQVIREEMQLYIDEQRTDVHGNVIAALIPIRVLSDKFEWQVTHEHAAKCYQLERILVLDSH